jgi:heterotetrameric sarcosine oxidase delta subunit
MRIHCPFCGERDQAEFVYLGDASVQRPEGTATDAQERFVEAVYLRANPAGLHEELWYHSFGCRSWLRVTRDTRTHEIVGVARAKGEAAR